jgi:flagellar biosynthesis chaperone FliJ
MAVAKPLHLRLFLEGIEVPVIAAQISVNTNAPASAAIQIVPLDEAQDFKPRTMVHLFFLDTQNVYEGRSKTETTKNPLVFQGIKGTYRLLYSGEVVGFSVVQSPMSRGHILQCVDFSNYWDSAHATAISYGTTGNLFTNQSAVYGSDSQLFDDIVNFPAERLVQWINNPPGPETEGLKSIGGLAGGIIKMLEAMGGVPGHTKGINDFFTVAELRCRLLQQIAAEENDNTAHRVLGGTVFMEWLRNGLQSLGEQVTFRDMMNMLFKYIFYDFVPNPAAKFEEVKKGSGTAAVGGQTYKLAQSPLALSALQHISLATTALATVTVADEKDDAKVAAAATSALKEVKKADADLAKLQKAIASASGEVKNVRNNLQGVTNNLDKYSKQTASGTGVTGKVLQWAQDQLNIAGDIIRQQKGTVTVARQEVSFDTTQRLKTQIIRPDCWFSAPPKCNVIFPEQFAQISYDRNWLAETTRVLVQEFDTLIGSDALLNNYYLAPGFGTGSADLNKEMKGEASYRVLLDHEIHTGILPKSEMLPNTSAINPTNLGGKISKQQIKSSRATWCHRAALFHFFKYRFGPRQLSVAGRFNPFLVCGFPALVLRRPYIVDINVVRKQVQATHGGASYQVTNSDIHTNSKDLNAPSQFVGMVAGLNHNVDQSGGTTSLSMHHVRRHLGVDDDFLSIFLNATSTSKRTVKTIISYYDLIIDPRANHLLLKLLVDLTPQGPVPPVQKLTKVSPTSTTAQSSVASQAPGSASATVAPTTNTMASSQTTTSTNPVPLPPLCQIGTIDGVQGDPTGGSLYIPSKPGKVGLGGKGIYATKNGNISGIQVLVPGEYNTKDFRVDVKGLGKAFPVIALYEDVEIEVTGTIPIEEIIRPAWFSLAYRNDRIGKDIYDNFFGCDSIIDELVVQLPGGSEADLPTSPGDPDIPSNGIDVTPDQVISSLKADEAQRVSLSIEKATNLLGFLYAQVKTKGLDVDDFIRTYTDRYIATIDDIFGEGEGKLLKFSRNGDKFTAYKDGDPKAPVKIGFHSVAVNEDLSSRGKLAGLVVDPTTGFTRYGALGASAPIPERYDVRPEKRERVLDYIQVLKSRGQGLRG